jgi:glutamate synthase (NADPH/NADH) large chain
MAKLGFRTFNEMIGQVGKLDTRKAIAHWKAHGVDLSKILYQPEHRPGVGIHWSEKQNHHLDKALDQVLIREAAAALESQTPVRLQHPIKNVNRTTGAMLSGEVARKYGHAGLPEETISVNFTGTAGQSFGAFLARGVSLYLTGDGNDYVGKSLSGGRVVVRQPPHVARDPAENIIVGNTVLYGAIAGEAYFQGVAGERFAVRNSGAIAVVEGCGDHGCEYMTGGVVVVLGMTGRNFAAGMSGGVAYVYDPEGTFKQRCNLAMVDLEAVIDEEVENEKLYHQTRDLFSHGKVKVVGDLTRLDAARIRHLVEKHVGYTDSAVGKRLLADWSVSLSKFRKVIPVEYREAMLKLNASDNATLEPV